MRVFLVLVFCASTLVIADSFAFRGHYRLAAWQQAKFEGHRATVLFSNWIKKSGLKSSALDTHLPARVA